MNELEPGPIVRGVVNRAKEYWGPYGSLSVVQCDDRHKEIITNWYRSLRANNVGKPVSNAASMRGVVLRTYCDVSRITPLDPSVADAPFTRSWSANIIVVYAFGMKQNNRLAMSLYGGKAETIEDIKVSNKTVAVEVFLDWYAEKKELEVVVTDLDDDGYIGEQVLEGAYFVTGRSTNSTLSKSQNVNLSYSIKAKPKPEPGESAKPEQTVAAGAEAYQDEEVRRLKVRIEGARYRIYYGTFRWYELARADGSLSVEIGLAAEFLSDAELAVDQLAQEKVAACSGKRSLSGTVSFTDVITGAEAKFNSAVQCGVSATNIPYRVRWSVSPTLDKNLPELKQSEGMRSMVRWSVDSGVNKCFYQPGFRQGLAYRFEARSANGVASASIDVKADAISTQLTKKRYHEVTWK